MDEIEIYEYGSVELKKAFVITGFPTVGLVGTIASRFVVDTLKLNMIATFLSDYFPPVSVVSGSEPLPPVRIYAGEKKCGPNGMCNQLAVILSELSPPPVMLRPMANKIIEWCRKNECETIACIEGFNLGEEKEEVPLIGIGSTEKAREILKKYDVELMREGMVSGLSGILLYEGKRKSFDVFCLLAGTHANYPDAKASAKVLEIINKMLPEIKIDPEPLYREAEAIEEQIKAHIKEAQPSKPIYKETPIMYG